MRIIVTGTGGRLGAAVARHLRDRHQVVAYDRKALDLREPARIEDHFLALRYDAVINCAAVTSLEYCEKNPGEARAVNAEAPEMIARLCREAGARLIHVSTNYVYDGGGQGPCSETSPVNPLSYYARSKREGEERVLAEGGDVLVARTAWVFGPDRPAFVDQIAERAQKEQDCAAIGETFSSASYSADMAPLLERLLDPSVPGGIYNVSNEGSASWLEMGQWTLDTLTNLGWKLKCRSLKPQRLADMPGFTASRPLNTVMDLTKMAAATGAVPRPWREALTDYLTTYYGRA